MYGFHGNSEVPYGEPVPSRPLLRAGDSRPSWKVVYPLPEVLLIVLCGTMAGAEDFVEIKRWVKHKLEFLRRMLPFARGISSHDTLNDVMNALPAGLFAEAFSAWVKALQESEPDIVAIDGCPQGDAKRQGLAAGAARQRATRCTSSRPGRAGSVWCSARKRWPIRATRSLRSRSSWSGWSLQARW